MIADLLEMQRPGGPWLLCALAGKGDFPGQQFDDADEAGAWALKQNRAKRNVYFVPNEVRPGVNKKPSRAEIARVDWIFVDIDPAPKSDWGEEHERIKKLVTEGLAKKGIPTPTLVIDSGGGWQLGFKLRTPIDVTADPAKGEEVERIAKAMIALLDGDKSCFSIDHVYRLPGTTNYASPEKLKKQSGRPAEREAEVWSWTREPDGSLRTYTLDDFGQVAASTSSGGSRKAPSTTQERLPVPTGPYGVPELEAWAAANGKRLPDTALAALVHGRDADPEKYESRSEAAWAVCCGLARSRVPDELIVAALLDENNKGGAHVRDAQNPTGYAWEQVAKARAEVEAAQLVQIDGSGYMPKWDRTTKDGNPLTSFNNTVEALRAFGLEFGYDEFRKQRVIGGHYLQDFAGPLSDNAEVFLRGLLRKHFGFDTGKDNVHDAIAELCLHSRFDSLLAHVEALPAWDGVPRLDSWLVKFCGAADSVYSREVGAVVLMAAIARAFEPGAKFDYMLVLIGEQGIRKSSAVRILAGGDALFSDAPLLAAKDAKEILELTAGVWIQECAELDGISRKDTETLKAMIVRTHDKARAAYGRTTQEVPRRFVMIGTTNERRFLRDATGNRRFWPMEVERIDADGLAAARDQLMAEALARYRRGDARLWLGEEAEQIARRIQGEHLAVDGSFRETLEFLEPEGEFDGLSFVSTSKVYDVLGLPAGMRSGATAHRVAAAMASLGWASYGKPITRDGKKQRIYVRHDNEESPSPSNEKPPF